MPREQKEGNVIDMPKKNSEAKVKVDVKDLGVAIVEDKDAAEVVASLDPLTPAVDPTPKSKAP